MENKLIDEIRRLINREEYEEAEKLSLNLLHSTESKHVFFSLLGDIYLAQGRSIEAQLFFERALESAPDYQPALHGLEEIDYLISLVRLPSSHIISKFNTGELHSDDFILLYRMIRETDRRIELIESLKHDLHVTEGNWETIWFFAQEARLYEQFEAVDIFCEKILTVRPGFGYARELPKHVRGYYAAHDLDVYIEQFFEHHPKHVKFFIDIGASDGLYHSQVRRLFESFNWQGICVEAEHDQYLRVRKLYENTPVQCFHSIVSDISTPIQDELGSEMKTVDAILEENGIAETDFISVNTGSQAMAVLRGINFSRCAPLLLSVKTGEDKAEIEEFLAREGYQVCMDAGTHVFFERHLRHLVNSFPKEEIKEEFVQLSRQKKIIGLLLVTEPSPYLEPALRTFSLFNDSIVILNTLEEDSVHSQLTALKDDCSIEGLYRGTFNSVMSAYNALLQYGREHRGTHFCMGDVFSIPSGNMLEQDLYRSSIIELEPGESLFLNKTFLWKNIGECCESIQGQALKKELHPLAFADDGLILYDDDQLEEFCIPANLRGERFFVEGSRYSIIDLHFINFENALIYSSWQQCARLVQPEMVLQGSDNFIIPVTEDRVVLKKANPEWFKNIPFIGHDSFQAIDDWRVRKIYEWFNQFGIDYFKDLPIWEINWKNYAALATYTPFTPAVIEMEGTSLMQTGTNKMRVAELAIQNNDYGVAERVLLDILAEDPKNIDALNNLAVIKILLEDYKNAEEILKRLTGIAPDDETANENLSYLKKIGKL